MPQSWDAMMNLYDRGLLSRRDLMQGLLLLAAPAEGLAQSKASTPVVVGHTVNHVQIMVRDLAASADFYEKLVGAKKEPRSNPAHGRWSCRELGPVY